MVFAAGSGELLFTPRVGASYGYTLLWAMLAAVVLKWFINREIGRYSVCTGNTIIDGFAGLPGPKNWAIYVILIPQVFVAVATIAGLAGSAATALIVALPGDIRIWTIVAICVSTALVIWGKFKAIPIILYLMLGEPVELLKIAGAIEACHIPFVVVLILYLNHESLPDELKPSKISFSFTAVAGLFFSVFAGIYVLQLMGVLNF